MLGVAVGSGDREAVGSDAGVAVGFGDREAVGSRVGAVVGLSEGCSSCSSIVSDFGLGTGACSMVSAAGAQSIKDPISPSDNAVDISITSARSNAAAYLSSFIAVDPFFLLFR